MVKSKISIQEDIFQTNDQIAVINNKLLKAANLYSINIMASPGAGKTSLIERTVRYFSPGLRLMVIDGDIATSFDADRAEAAGAYSVQVNTGGECHLDANMVNAVLAKSKLDQFDLLILENVGNLVCPASFKLGTHQNVLVASIPEGDDKPYKYPGIYRGVDVLVINKIDLLPYVPFRMDFFRAGVEALNPGLKTFEVSCQTGEGLQNWFTWLLLQVNNARNKD